ncbi:hypothetical protein D9756_002548 [Leucocoprinus leucothites]|uniref:Uncharacterized protein n=1 Tax=Leucocoprinus leucothites TaxID=201217 RepID=A0A8H5GBZ3_9AGAR|nr:hypothetical protein D9756_002548 [Leucoagaricus leucothites]
MAEVTRGDMIASVHMSIGVIVMALLDGVLFTLGVLCIFLLHSGSARPSMQQKLLVGYIILLILVNLITVIVDFIWSHFPFLLALNPAQGQAVQVAMEYFANLMPLVSILVTDALLLWRCYRVQKILGPNQGAKSNVFWVIPSIFWVAMLVTGITAATFCREKHLLMAKLVGMSLGMNVLINLYAAAFIITRLLLHKRMTMARLGDRIPMGQHLRLISIVLQSAVLNVPVTFAALVCIVSGDASYNVLSPIAVTCQSLSVVLIIHQVASRRTVDAQDEQKTERWPNEGRELTNFSVALSDNPGASHIP